MIMMMMIIIIMMMIIIMITMIMIIIKITMIIMKKVNDINIENNYNDNSDEIFIIMILK